MPYVLTLRVACQLARIIGQRLKEAEEGVQPRANHANDVARLMDEWPYQTSDGQLADEVVHASSDEEDSVASAVSVSAAWHTK